jgi:hypothetical protein
MDKQQGLRGVRMLPSAISQHLQGGWIRGFLKRLASQASEN